MYPDVKEDFRSMAIVHDLVLQNLQRLSQKDLLWHTKKGHW